MFLAQIPFPDIDPVAVSIGPLEIRWYGILFVLGFIVGQFLLTRLAREGRLPVPEGQIGDLLIWLMVGIVIGGRLGYVFIYDLAKYVEDPFEALRIWKGGLSFHGGLVGAFVAAVAFCRRRRIPLVRLLDAMAACTCPGILFVRSANFINGELWGRPTDVPWAMVFPRDPEALPRHPSQIYEGLLEGVALFLFLWFARNRPWMRPPGRLTGAFLVGYGLLRFLVEFAREPDEQLGTVLGPLSMGQVLSAGLALLGGGVLLWSHFPNVGNGLSEESSPEAPTSP